MGEIRREGAANDERDWVRAGEIDFDSDENDSTIEIRLSFCFD